MIDAIAPSTERSREPLLSDAYDLIDWEGLPPLAADLSGDYAAARPFPHCKVDGFFDERLLDRVLEEFPDPESACWKKYDTKYEIKKEAKKLHAMGPVTQAFIQSLNSSRFLRFLETVTGIPKLIPDPHLSGGGLHQIPRGGKLGIHVDFNRNKDLDLERRVNLLIYLNKDWKEEYGGHIEFWERNLQGEHVKYLPLFNRMAIFSTTATSWHGHPVPLSCPQGRYRRSIALYYYTSAESGNQNGFTHTTIFADRAGHTSSLSWKQILKRCVPPILTDGLK
jgi:Rps23 Pro-64 3,4-dihydroxylase Tpa1-like proline 4-hydroxylase